MMNQEQAAFHSSFITHHSSFTFMSLPEISRRCRSCGAAVRAGGRFCPQCGEQVSDAADSSAASAGQDSSAPETREVESLPVVGPTREVESPGEWTPPTKEYAVF